MSKKALQDSVMRQIEERTVELDSVLADGMSDEGNRRAQDRRRREIMKTSNSPSLCHSLVAPQVQADAPSNQRITTLVCPVPPGKPATLCPLGSMPWQRPNIGSRASFTPG